MRPGREKRLLIYSSLESSSGPARVLLLSQKNIYKPEVWRGTFNEFETIVQEIDSVDVLAPKPGKYFMWRKRNAQRIGKVLPVALNPGLPSIKLNREYDLFLAVCEKPSELLTVGVLKGWKEKCKISVCWLPEFWINEIPYQKASLKVLSQFDHVFLNVARTVEPMSRAIDKECVFLPAGVDTLEFSPYPNPPQRFIDVLSIGRRSDQTHQILMRMARQKKIFYHYDTLRELHAYDIAQHRFLLASLARRSRYFIVNPGKIDLPDEGSAQIEFGYRYFEGAAAGTILIGDYPNSQEFREYFFWPDVVIHLPFGSEKIEKTMEELDQQPVRQEKIRKTNVRQSLLNHDWAFRWEKILRIVGLEPKPKLLERKERLRELAHQVERDDQSVCY
jgi:hypothetical protein